MTQHLQDDTRQFYEYINMNRCTKLFFFFQFIIHQCLDQDIVDIITSALFCELNIMNNIHFDHNVNLS